MTTPRQHLTTSALTPLTHEAFGPHRRLLDSERIRGCCTSGRTLEDALRRDPARPALGRLSEALRGMHGHEGPRYGKVGLVDGGVGQGSGTGAACGGPNWTVTGFGSTGCVCVSGW